MNVVGWVCWMGHKVVLGLRQRCLGERLEVVLRVARFHLPLPADHVAEAKQQASQVLVEKWVPVERHVPLGLEL